MIMELLYGSVCNNILTNEKETVGYIIPLKNVKSEIIISLNFSWNSK